MSNFSFSLNHHLELPDDVFRLLRDNIYRRSGIWFNDTSKYLLQKRLSPRRVCGRPCCAIFPGSIASRS